MFQTYKIYPTFPSNSTLSIPFYRTIICYFCYSVYLCVTRTQKAQMFKQQIIGFLFTLFFFAIDTYVWQGIKTITPQWSNKAKSILKWSYWGYSCAVFIFFVLIRFEIFTLSPSVTKLISAVVFAIVIAKIFWVFFLLIDDLIRLFRWIYQYFLPTSLPHPINPVASIV